MSEIPVIGWQIDASFGDKVPRVLRAQTHIASDASPAEIDSLLDKISRAQDRQIGFYKLEHMYEQFKDMLGYIERYEADLIRVDETAKVRWEGGGRRGEWDPDKHLTGAEKNAKRAAENTLNQTREKAIALKAEIEKLEAKIGTWSTVGGADHHVGVPESQGAGNDGTGWPDP